MREESFDLTLAANQGALGGGEVMLLHVASAALELGLGVRVVAPAEPDDLLRSARTLGVTVVGIPGSRRAYARQLRRWDRERRGLLWSFGLLPSLASSGHPGRVVHLHQLHTGAKGGAARLATRRAERVLVPSQWVADRTPGATVLHNWTADIPYGPHADVADPVRVGFLGRLALEKGITHLAHAVADLDRRQPGRYRLVLGGSAAFAGAAERRAVEQSFAPIGHLLDRRGWVRPEAFFPDVDLLVLPSLAEESFGLVAAEAMAAGVPFVVTDAGATREVVGADHPWLVARGDSRAIADMIEQVVGAHEVRGAHQRAGRRRWEAMFSPDHGLTAVRDLLGELGLEVPPVDGTELAAAR